MSSLETVMTTETQSSTRQPVNVLLLEDAPGDIELFTMFVRGNVIVDVASNGAEALDRLFCRGRFRNVPLPDVVLCDLKSKLRSKRSRTSG
jgi:CheY-like chemotaxis protein